MWTSPPEVGMNPTLVTRPGWVAAGNTAGSSVPNPSLPNHSTHPSFSHQPCLYPLPNLGSAFFLPLPPACLPACLPSLLLSGGSSCGLTLTLLLCPLFKHPWGGISHCL